MTRKNILFMSAIAAFIVAFLAGAGVYFWVMNNNSEIVVPVSANSIQKGHAITESDIITVKINPNAAAGSIIYNTSQLIGNYSLRDMGPSEYFYSNWISTSYTRRLAERLRYSAVPASTNQIQSVNGEIKEDDFVKITIIVGDTDATTNINDPSSLGTGTVKLIEPPELSAVRVLGIYDSSGIDINEKKDLIVNPDGSVDPNSSLPQGSFIVFDCTDIQRALIIQAEHMGNIQLVILPEAEQQEERIKWGLVEPEEDSEDNFAGAIDVGIDYSEDEAADTPAVGSEEDLAAQEARRNELISDKKAENDEIIRQAAEEQGVVLDDVDISNVSGSVSDTGAVPEQPPSQQG